MKQETRQRINPTTAWNCPTRPGVDWGPGRPDFRDRQGELGSLFSRIGWKMGGRKKYSQNYFI